MLAKATKAENLEMVKMEGMDKCQIIRKVNPGKV
jgi:hypothetical protein